MSDVNDTMELEGAEPIDSRFSLDGRRDAPVPYYFEHGYLRPNETLVLWPEGLVERRHNKYGVNFNSWLANSDAFRHEYTRQVREDYQEAMRNTLFDITEDKQ